MTLTDEQVAQYHKDGYLVLRAAEHGIVDPEKLRTWTDEIFTWPDGSHKWLLYHETNTQGKRQLMRTERFAEHHQGYGQLLFGKQMRSILEQLSGDVRIPPLHHLLIPSQIIRLHKSLRQHYIFHF